MGKTIGIYTERYGYFDNIHELTAEDFRRKSLRYMFTHWETITSDGLYIYEGKTDGNFYYITESELRRAEKL